MEARIQAPALDGGMPPAVAALKRELARRGIDLAYCADGASAVAFLLSRIPAGATVMNGGSTTLEQIGFLEALKNGPYDWLRPGIAAIADPDERIRVRRRAGTADYFVGGINAVTASGEILNADGGGNRVAAYAYGAGKLFLVAGVNKIVPDIAAAFERLRNRAAVEECRHLNAKTPCALTGRCDNAACRGADRQCGKVLIIENERIAGRICVVVIGEELGY
ncbi:MAG: lactate utilization protein [Betaproteobacteria bacterium]|nr:MAG: lactate utilization protein [Betaproteobacteria bacterium]